MFYISLIFSLNWNSYYKKTLNCSEKNEFFIRENIQIHFLFYEISNFVHVLKQSEFLRGVVQV